MMSSLFVFFVLFLIRYLFISLKVILPYFLFVFISMVKNNFLYPHTNEHHTINT